VGADAYEKHSCKFLERMPGMVHSKLGSLGLSDASERHPNERHRKGEQGQTWDCPNSKETSLTICSSQGIERLATPYLYYKLRR
jgi:hypothetical protein